jgi:putative hydrolase of the HAD superfamily
MVGPGSEGRVLNELKAVVFDLDDTLYPQIEFKRSGFRAVSKWLAERHPLGEDMIYAALTRVMEERGPSHPFLFDEALALLGLPAELTGEMVNVFRAHRPEISPYPGVMEMLSRLRGRYRLGLLTDGLASVQRNKVAALGIVNCFDAILYSDEMGTNKPDTRLFVWFEERLGLSGHDLGYVADNPAKDFIGARARGWRTIRVGTGEHAEVEPQEGLDADLSFASALAYANRLIPVSPHN